MKKKIGIVLVVVLLSTAALFAQGTREMNDRDVRTGIGRYASEEVTVYGTLNVTDEEVVLVTSEGSYSLSAPTARFMDLESFDGEYVEIEGTLSQECDDCINGYDGHLFVTSASADGQEYEFDSRGRAGMQPSRGNDLAARGKARTPMTGRGASPRTNQAPRGNSRGPVDSYRGYAGGGI